MPLNIVILAAGQGTRMRSAIPKVMHQLAGKPLLGWVLDAAAELGAERTILVHGHGSEQVRQAFADRRIHWVLQAEQRGTGHAVQQVLPELDSNAQVLVLYGDVPLIRPATLQELISRTGSNLGLLTLKLDDPSGYGRIVRDRDGSICAIVEQKDATPEQLEISEINTGIMCIPGERLFQWIPRLKNANAQGEYYLTDLIEMAVNDQVQVVSLEASDAMEVAGVNSRSQLAELERHYQRSQAEKLMAQGVSLADPNRFDLRGNLTVGSDVFIDVGVVFEGEVVLENHVEIGAYCLLRDTVVREGAHIVSHSVLESAEVGADAKVGPFARLRPGAVLAENTRVGNFVEIKKSRIGAGSKVNHLSYVGDAELGSGVNIGAGTITANYDGTNKHQTHIGDGASTGSNSVLVAPVRVGAGAYIGAGSVITREVPDGALAIARGRQRNVARDQGNKESS